ncbi:DUF4124 domain-containing protein [Rhodoferax ferrireducens]|uniref:DUF4124 domain-containing protein n=1 Tax=Rhodoferax ferrireducens TaxID=192843 RepID=UPI000E0E060F
MKKSITVILLFIALTGAAQAQLRKCTGPDGRITYSDVLCATTSKSIQSVDIPAGPAGYQAPPGDRPSQASVYERELSGKIAGHLARGDFDRASTLAVTVEHHQMIADARQNKVASEQAKKDARRAARPTVCSTFGVNNGLANSYGAGNMTSYSGTYSGTTVCNK